MGWIDLGTNYGIGTEWMYKNISASYAIGKDNEFVGNSIGMKVYNSEEDSKHKVFGGVNYIHTLIIDKTPEANHFAIIGGYRYTSNHRIYFSPYIGITHGRWSDFMYSYTAPSFGLNIGYQFKPIQMK